MKQRNQNCGERAGVFIYALILAVVFFCQPVFLSAQKAKEPAARPGNSSSGSQTELHPFEPSEELIYVAEFSRALLKKVDIAEFRFTAGKQPSLQKVSDSEIKRATGGDPNLLRLTGDVSSKGFFAKLFNLHFREQIESIVDRGLFTVRKTSKVDQQGRRARVSEAIYKDGKVSWVETDPNDPSRPPRKAESTFTGQVQDLLSAIYYLRTQPLEVGKTFDITVSDSGAVYQVPVKVIEKKHRKSVLGRLEAFRVEPQVFSPEGLIQDEGEFSIWITSDTRRIPVSARIKMKYGTFDITLRKLTRNPESLAGTQRAR